jgi:hypothetical protein
MIFFENTRYAFTLVEDSVWLLYNIVLTGWLSMQAEGTTHIVPNCRICGEYLL